MSFTPNIPQGGQSLGQTQAAVLNNFAALRQGISNTISTKPNHVDVNGPGAAGRHIFVQMPVQTAGAPNLPAAGEGGLITQTVSGSSELFYVRDNVNTYLQMTGPILKGASNLSTGYTPLFGGMILQWGSVPSINNGTVISFPMSFANYCLSVVATPLRGNNTEHSFYINSPSINKSGFTVQTDSTGGGIGVSWIAIGY